MISAFRMIAGGCAAAAIAAPALAHHSPSRFDRAQTVAFEGVVTGVEWANPHVYLTVEQATESGETIAWEVETVGPSALRRVGWARDTLSVGDRISLTGNPDRNAERKSLNLGLLERDGQVLYNPMGLMREYSTPSAALTPASGLDGTWAVLLKLPLIVPFLPGAPGPVLTDAGAAAAAGFDEETMLPALACQSSAAPFFMFVPDVKRIATDGDVIRIVGDYEGAERVVHMSRSDHDGAEPSAQGHSIGRWEGETLVIDTTHFADHRMAHAFGVPSGAQKHLVERLALSEDGLRVVYHFELSDPEFLAKPIVGDAEWAHRPDLELSPETCEPGNAKRFAAE
jgi:hypothetical protein